MTMTTQSVQKEKTLPQHLLRGLYQPLQDGIGGDCESLSMASPGAGVSTVQGSVGSASPLWGLALMRVGQTMLVGYNDEVCTEMFG
jgi:hypothetical protein